MTNLIKAEFSRLLARRVMWIGVVIAVVGCLFALIANLWSIQPPGEEQQAQLTKQYESYVQLWETDKTRFCDPTDAQCLAAPMTLEQWTRTSVTFNSSISNLVTASSLIAFFVTLIVAASALGGEFATGSISNQLSFVPNRNKVYVAKGLVTMAVSTALTTLLIGATVTLGWLSYLVVNGAALTVGAEGSFAAAARGILVGLFGGLVGFTLAALVRHTAVVVTISLGYAFFHTSVDMFVHLFNAPWLYRVVPHTNLFAILSGEVRYSYWPDAGPTGVQPEPTIVFLTWADGIIYWASLLALLGGLSWYVFQKRSLS